MHVRISSADPPTKIAPFSLCPRSYSVFSVAAPFHSRPILAEQGTFCRLAVPPRVWQPIDMSDRIAPNRKNTGEILNDLFAGHNDARIVGAEKGKKYLQSFFARANSIPNAVKFFLYDLLAEDAFRSGDIEACRAAVAKAAEYLPAAQEETLQRFREYAPSIRLFELGISLAIDDGEFEKALSFCDQAIAIGLGKAYVGKKASIERMM